MAIDQKAIREVLTAASVMLRSLSEEKEKLAARVEQYERNEQAGEIVTMMEERGMLDPSDSLQTKLAHVLGSDESLDVVKKAVALAPSGVTLGSLSDVPAEGDETLESYLAD